jgi:predicted Zn-ribbon and HTH transcriptional regulator
MMRFLPCPKCKAQREDDFSVPCWNCGDVIGAVEKKDGQPETKRHPDLIDPNDFSDPYLVQGIAFKACGNCGAHCEAAAAKCWDCGTKFKAIIPTASQPGDEGSAIADRKAVPFGDITIKPPEEKKKPSLVNAVGKVLKGHDYDPSDEVTDKERADEREFKRERRLILFHCQRCNGYFKVIFRKVRDKVKCPECKNTLMKIPYFCTRCKTIDDFSTIDEHFCKTCNLTMILDPNFE